MARITRERWLEEGLKLLAGKGFKHLTLSELLARLKVTHGSFYHHFRNRRDYTEALLQAWQQQMTVDVISGTEAIGDLDVADAAPFPTEPAPAVTQPAAVAAEAETLVGETAAASAASAFAGLAASFQKPEPAPVASAADMNFMSGNTVEAMVREMLRPMLKDWLDANLPAIVEAQVRKEVERIARNAG